MMPAAVLTGCAAAWRVMLEMDRPTGEQMLADERLAQEAQASARMFGWVAPALSVGWKRPRPMWLDERAERCQGIPVVERPTGGAVACHGSDASCGIVIPHHIGLSLRQAMTMVCESAAALCRSFGAEEIAVFNGEAAGRLMLCLTERSPYGVYIGARKVAGFALRRYPRSWLIQGSLLVAPLPAGLAQALPTEVRAALEARAVSLSEAVGTPLEVHEAAARWAKAWPAWSDAAWVGAAA